MNERQSVSGMPRFHAGLLHPRYWPTWLGLALFRLFSLLPIAIIDAVAGALGKGFYRINAKRVRFAHANLMQCFPELSAEERDEIVKQHFVHQMRSVMHYGLIWWSSRRRLESMIDLQGAELVAQARAAGKNVIALTSHSVGLEFSVTAMGLNWECSGPYKPMKNALIDWMVAGGRTRFAVKAFARSDGLRPIIKDTRAGRLMIYLADEDLGRDNSVFASFFAAQKATLPVLARLVKNCNAVVIPCSSCYDVRRHQYVVKLYDIIDGFEDHDELDSAEHMNRAIERTVNECIPQYFWTLRLFKTRPEGEPNIYA